MFIFLYDISHASASLCGFGTHPTCLDLGRSTPFKEAISAIESCRKPVVAAFHSGVVGAGVDLASACDVRLCSKDCWFCIAEVNVGLAADVGTLQRLPKIVGNDSVVRELALTGAEGVERLGESCVLAGFRGQKPRFWAASRWFEGRKPWI